MTLVLEIFFVIHESEISSGIKLISSDKSSTLVFITCVNGTVSILCSVDDNRELKQIRRRRKRERQVKM